LAENAIKPDQAVWHVSTADNMPYKFWRWQLLVLEHLSGDLSLLSRPDQCFHTVGCTM